MKQKDSVQLDIRKNLTSFTAKMVRQWSRITRKIVLPSSSDVFKT